MGLHICNNCNYKTRCTNAFKNSLMCLSTNPDIKKRRQLVFDNTELKKFGFKPKYDVDTGKIKKYIKQETYYGFDINKEYIAISIEENSIQKGQYDRIDFWQVHLGEKTDKSIDLLYDLIKADLVEKVRE